MHSCDLLIEFEDLNSVKIKLIRNKRLDGVFLVIVSCKDLEFGGRNYSPCTLRTVSHVGFLQVWTSSPCVTDGEPASGAMPPSQCSGTILGGLPTLREAPEEVSMVHLMFGDLFLPGSVIRVASNITFCLWFLSAFLFLSSVFLWS